MRSTYSISNKSYTQKKIRVSPLHAYTLNIDISAHTFGGNSLIKPYRWYAPQPLAPLLYQPNPVS
nr:AlNc14C29G2769 [Albugo laibachii Nc14]|eukprot:CCA17054.1 AlNc14C29G2769 [Albugo laibachii Nc14]